MVAGLGHLVELVARHEDGAALGGELAEQEPDLTDAGGVEAVGRLVEDEQGGVLEQRGGDAEALAHAEAVAADEVVGPVGETDPLEHGGDVAAVDRPGERSQQLEVAPAGHRREQGRRLDDRRRHGR